MTTKSAFSINFELFLSLLTALGTLKHGPHLVISAGGLPHGVLQVDQEKK